jgi:hypothetical protein
MTERFDDSLGAFKIWRNPASRDEPIEYMGEYYPTTGRRFFTVNDLRGLGFRPGVYTIRTPENAHDLPSKWQKVSLPDDQHR